MLFKLSRNNIKNSFRDYAIYFYTLVIGVSVFYAFNAVTGQTATLELTGELGRTAQVLSRILSGMSVFVAVVLGLLIAYASRFLMKRRSREFAVYLMLGMGKRAVSLIIFMETILTGVISLFAGIIIGIGLSQIMGVFVVRLFNESMMFYSFRVSPDAIIKTIIYFVIMYLVVMLMSGHAISRMKLIDLLNSGRKTESIKLKNPVLCVLIFILACVMLGTDYYIVAGQGLNFSPSLLVPCIAVGAVSTVMIFWSVSGMILRIAGSMKKNYYSGLTSFTFRQISSKINTVVLSMSVICLMLFFTICALSSAFSMRETIKRAIEQCPADFQIRHSEILVSDDDVLHLDDIVERYAGYGYDLPARFEKYVHFHTYYDPAMNLDDISALSPSEVYYGHHGFIDVVKLSDYNALMKMYGRETLDLPKDKFVFMCTLKANQDVLNRCLLNGENAVIFGHSLTSMYNEVQDGFLEISAATANPGLIVIPDEVADENGAADDFFIGNYMADSDGDRAAIETECRDEYMDVKNRMEDDADDGILENGYYIQYYTRAEYKDTVIGSSALATIVFMYIGIVFLISCGAILALRELSDSVDSIPRYDILRKIGADEKDIEKSLFTQSAVFFLMPLLLAAVHSVFGMKMASMFISLFGNGSMIVPALGTCLVILILYGGYFFITYNAGRRIIRPDRELHVAMTGGDMIKFCGVLAAVVIVCVGVSFAAGIGKENPYATGTPWIDCDLEGVVTKKTPAELKDNFALAANKEAILDLEIPENEISAGLTVDIDSQAGEDVRKLFKEERPQSHDAKQIYDMYQLMTDWDSRDKAGVASLKEKTDAVENVSSIDELTKYLSETPESKRFGMLWEAASVVDFNDSNRYVLYISPCGLTLGDSAEYRKLSESGRKEKKVYRIFAINMLTKLGYTEAEAGEKVDNKIRFETLAAGAIPTADEKGRPSYREKSNNRFTRQQLMEAQGRLPILQELENVQGYPAADDYIVECPAFLTKMNELYTEENLPLIRDYLITGGVISEAGNLDRECCKWQDEYTSALDGVKVEMKDDDLIESASNMLSWATAKYYTETYLKEEDKIRISELVDEIIEEYHGIIEEADFLSDETRSRALEKLESMDKRILYPDNWDKYSYEGLDFKSKEEGGTYLEALEKLAEFNHMKTLEQFSEPVDKTKWDRVPYIANCFYSAQTNSVCITGAFARGDVYDSEMSDEEIYGKLGVVIGHEISHAFDSTGAQFDKDGNMSNWWKAEDKDIFREKNKRLAAFYNSIHPWEGQYLKGSIMTGEACADMAGMECMLRIAAKKQGFNYDKFFRSFAAMWLTKDKLQCAKARVNDAHPMPYLRVNATLQQFDEFLDFYGIKEGDGMYLAPEDRIKIW